MTKRLILFDIDGTLLTTNGRGRHAFKVAIEEEYGRPFDPSTITFSGKTDRQILGEVLAHIGVAAHENDETFRRGLEMYESTMMRFLDRSWVTVLAGVRELLSKLSERLDVQLGLLTGNLERTAYMKLRLAELDFYFPFGAFGSDDSDRYQLPRIAVERAFEQTGHRFVGGDVIIVGDTEHDIRCGLEMGARSVAVCTGLFSRDELARHDPHWMFDDLSSPDLFIRQVLDSESLPNSQRTARA